MQPKRTSKMRRWLGTALRLAFRVPFLSRLGLVVAAERHKSVHLRAVSNAKAALAGDQNYPVLRGPFRGMRFPHYYGDEALWLRKVLGAYERELQEPVEQICKTGYTRVVNIGTAEGFYCVGLARRLPSAEIIGFETDETARQAFRKLASTNNVAERIVLCGTCDVEALRKLELKRDKVLLLVDCEGAEFELLRPRLVPELGNCDLLIELHALEPSDADPFESIRELLSDTHSLRFIACRPRVQSHYEELNRLTPLEAEALLSEGRRNSVGWVFARSHRHHGSEAEKGGNLLSTAHYPYAQ